MLAGYSVRCRRQSVQIILMINSLARIPSWIAQHWKSGAVVAGFVGIAATCRWCLETDEVRDQRAQRRNKKELRALADKFSTYGRWFFEGATGGAAAIEVSLNSFAGKWTFTIISNYLSFLNSSRRAKGVICET